ncbi:MAG: 3-isopropylmalate dehydrogenase [Candidatus Levybacteria bacterium RIFCSPHIGHO2_12_FULL_38_12]|nr:MAG: 3-isopropylmalate dehydrogenase [Candidatus Levybacteria bacterium RIFCSPHIGHO2_01_FULL_38_12]OGH22802.1 MAG: 3-isopropylmalate dehydrogenase [Candidatus Levybacteria bacterium RIFCSPHIGHO2_12_FULL_38_12]OGH33977.1 MAG: 3-isopropylmalate dehydrogenase [Candidatus Levybacteria bacterium RIFCSPLOWO2_01_FULL_37_20]OGH44811.1 MAG: 3-isopropylmalate dehydrogenase [Candidatus Levybacteria bacterium RIFCSPLOWO2_02_FULL_37_18]
MKKTIAVLPGDGVGPEVTKEAVKVLKKVAEKFNHEFELKEERIGAIAIDQTGKPLPKATLKLCKSSDAILLGAVGDPKHDNPSLLIRPEQGLLKLRKSLELYANIRPIISFTGVSNPIFKPGFSQNIDFVIVRELTGGSYFGKPRGRKDNGQTAFETNIYSKEEIIRVTKVAFDLAKKRNKKVTLVDKANVLETSKLWREVVGEYVKDFPDIILEYMYADSAALNIIKKPKEFDVILTDNMFGDILSDEAAALTGSIGLLPSASIGKQVSLYEPIHGSFPKAKGTYTANPIATILSGALMLEYSFNLIEESRAVFIAVKKVLSEGLGTKDIQPANPLQTNTIGDKIVEFI